MKKKLQEQREKAIIESFAKTFNKIKRLDEQPLRENDSIYKPSRNRKKVGLLITGMYESNEAIELKNLLDREGLDGVFAVTYGNGWWEDIQYEKYGKFGVLFGVSDIAEAKKIVNILFTHNSKSPFYRVNRFDYEIVNFGSFDSGTNFLEPIEGVKELDEINIGKGIATLGLAASMMGAPKDADAQTQPQGIEKSMSDTSNMALPQDNVKAGKTILDSYRKNPFTADMWSKKSRENLRFFKMVKKLIDNYSISGQIEYSDYEQLGAMAKQSSLGIDFLQRKKEDISTAKLK